jgi:aminoglycoside 3-N-acetyltransferase
MKERRLVEQTGDVPVTADSLVRDFTALGLEAGDVVIVHASLSSLGWVCGGAVAVIDAISHVLGPTGTLVMPTHSSQLSEPSHWRDPPVLSSWWPIIRDTMPPFDPRTTPTRGMGAIAETFRTLPGVVRSAHPQVSFTARGPCAEDIAGNHDTDFGLGEGSPLSRLYDLQGRVLLIGVGHESNTSLHLAEYRLAPSQQCQRQEGAPVLIDGVRKWIEFRDLDVCASDFPQVGRAFEQSTSLVRQGHVGKTTARLMPQRALVDFAVQWMTEHRTPKPSTTRAAIAPSEPRNDTSVREWTHDDLDAAAALFVTCFSQPPWSETWTEACARTRLGDIIATPRFRGMVAYQAGALAAIAMGHIEESKDGAEFLLQELCVAPPVQKTGVGTGLVRTLAEALADEGVEKLYLITRSGSPAAQFFRGAGLAESSRAVVMGGQISSILSEATASHQHDPARQG